MEITLEEISDLVHMEVQNQLESIREEVAAAMSEWGRIGGRVGGRARNPRKGFGSGDNARKAVLARWAKYRAKKALTEV